MHVVGLFTTASTLDELDDMVESAAVVFGSPRSGDNVERHHRNLQSWLTRNRVEVEKDPTKSEDDTEDLTVNESIISISEHLFVYAFLPPGTNICKH